MTDSDLKDIELRLNKASRGPWKSFIEGKNHSSGDSFIMTGISEGEDIWSEHRGEDIYLSGATESDQEFIANARQDIPNLLNEIKLLKKEIAKIK